MRIQERDGRLGDHLCRTRMLSTYQLAKLEFGGKVDAARRRLYDLNGEMIQSMGYSVEVKAHEEAGAKKGAGLVWRLTKEYFEAHANRDDNYPDRKYPGPLRRGDVPHLIATNGIYTGLAPELTENILGLYPEDWRWLCEPFCHRRYHNHFGAFKLTPDAEIRVFDTTFLLERQTAAARKKPEAIHDKVFRYHRYANSARRRADTGDLILTWACDEERDARLALEASRHHPTKKPAELQMEEHDRERMRVVAGTPEQVVNTILATAQNYGELPDLG